MENDEKSEKPKGDPILNKAHDLIHTLIKKASIATTNGDKPASERYTSYARRASVVFISRIKRLGL